MSRLVAAGSYGAALLAAHAALNARLLRRPPPAAAVDERVSVLLPLRNEADRVESCLASVLTQRGCRSLEVVVVDDGSTDATSTVVRKLAAGDPRVRLIQATPLPPGWLGKTHACQQAAATATGRVLVFVDADVALAPDGVARTVALLRRAGLDFVSPYPRQLAGTGGERLIQPLLTWSWLSFLPLRIAERSPRPSLAAAGGQLLAVDAGAYRAAGGHAAVRGEVLDDITLARRLRACGFRGGMADGSTVATCRMYAGWQALRDGYGKSLWAALGSPARTAAATMLLGWLYVVPPVAALRGSRAGLAGYLAGVAGRAIAARTSGMRAWPDAITHPVSIAALAELAALSWRRRAAGTLSWKGRPI
jgi:hypothetical protein